MEKAVPGDQTIESLIECQLAHILFQPALCGKSVSGPRQHRRGTINAGKLKTLLDKITGDRLAVAAANIHNAALPAHHGNKFIEPAFLEQGARALAGKSIRMASVDGQNIFCRRIAHNVLTFFFC